MSAREKLVPLPTKDSVSLLPCFYFVELPILVSSVVSLYFLEWTDVFKPVKSGFTCHDRSLSLPYIDPTHEVIPLLMLLSLAFAGPAITIMIGEAILFCCLSRRRSGGAEANINAAGCNFNSFIRRAVRFVGVHAFGLCATALITDVLQLMTGYPAPYFLTVCKPNYTTLNVSCEQNPFVMEDICSGGDPTAINQGRKSFPSQHATLASFAAVYVSMYFNSTLTDSSKLLKPLLVFSFTICGIICGLTRIIQYKNHAIDVYLGFLLGGAIAVYLGLYAVGNFQPSEESSCCPPPALPRPPCSLPHISQEAALQQLQLKALEGEGLLHRGAAVLQQRHDDATKHPDMDALAMAAAAARGRAPPSKDAMLTFSHTLPRVHTPQAVAAYEEAARRHAATLHHASMDSSRSKQLLSQWKSKNHRPPGADGNHHHGSMELRPSCESPAAAAAAGLNGGFDAYLSKLASGASTLPSNCSGITGGARIHMQQPRPGSSPLVHIPEEHEHHGNASPRAPPSPPPSTVSGAVQANWQRAAEKTAAAACRGGEGGTPRIMQVLAMSKQHGLLATQLATHSKSLDESSMAAAAIAATCQGNAAVAAARYRGFNDNDYDAAVATAPGSLSSATGSVCGSTGAIVRVEAHPENQRPVIPPPGATDGGGSWRWRSLDHGTAGGGGGGGSLRQSLELNDLNRDSESSDSARGDGSIDRKRSNHVTVTTATTAISTPPVVTVHTQSAGQSEQQRLHPQQQQGLSTIRVTPGDGGGGGGVAMETASESLSVSVSVSSSRESTLQRNKGNNMILIPERANSPESARNIFYKGTSMTPAFRD